MEMLAHLREKRAQVKNLFIIYSSLVIVVPLASMFLLKAYLFEGEPHAAPAG